MSTLSQMSIGVLDVGPTQKPVFTSVTSESRLSNNLDLFYLMPDGVPILLRIPGMKKQVQFQIYERLNGPWPQLFVQELEQYPGRITKASMVWTGVLSTPHEHRTCFLIDNRSRKGGELFLWGPGTMKAIVHLIDAMPTSSLVPVMIVPAASPLRIVKR